MVALQSHLTLYRAIPGRIEEAARTTLQGVRVAAQAEVERVTATAKADLAAAVATTARDVARDVVVTDRLKWTVTTVTVTCLVLGGFAWRMHAVGLEAGQRRGHVDGYHAARMKGLPLPGVRRLGAGPPRRSTSTVRFGG